MRYWKCDFCKHDTGPLKQSACPSWPYIFERTLCDGFELKTRMTPKEEQEWGRHENLNHFIDMLDIELMEYQRAYLHKLCFERPLYFVPARGGTKPTQLLLYVMILNEYEKYKKGEAYAQRND